MKPPVVRLASAADVEEAHRWYETQRAGLGDDFLEAVRAAVESVADHRDGACGFAFSKRVKGLGIHETFRLLVDGNPEPVTIAINSHFDAGWRTDVGALGSRGGRLTLRMPAGRHEVHLRYWPRSLTAGILVSALGLTGSGLFLYRRSRTNPRAAPVEGERPSSLRAGPARRGGGPTDL